MKLTFGRLLALVIVEMRGKVNYIIYNINMNIDPNKTLFLSDDFVFYTLEGEGRYVGYPSVFMRLSMCNLTCIGFKSEAAPFGCDSYVSWSKKNKMTFEEIAELFEKHGYHDRYEEVLYLKLLVESLLFNRKTLLSS